MPTLKSKLSTKFLMIAGMIGCLLLVGVIFFVATGLVPTAVQAQPASDAVTLPRTITVVGEGTTRVEPDLAQVNIGVMATGSEVSMTAVEAQSAMDQVLNALKTEGVDAKDIQTAGFNIYANSPQPLGPADQADSPELTYQVVNNVTVIVRDITKVSRILDEAIGAGANNIYGVTFSLADDSAAQSAARSTAMDNAQAKAEEIGGLAGVELGDVVSVSEVIGGPGGGYSPLLQAKALGGGPIETGQLEVQVQLQVVYSLQ